MKVIIAGSRTVKDKALVYRAILASRLVKQITEVVSGGAIGVDRIGEEWGNQFGYDVTIMRPNYKKYGRYEAPKKRNSRMVKYADGLIAIWDGKSGGTKDTIDKAVVLGLQVFVYNTQVEEKGGQG